MITLQVWTPDGKHHAVTAPQFGAALDLADNIGAVRVVDGDGWVLRKLRGEWVYICQSSCSFRETDGCRHVVLPVIR